MKNNQLHFNFLPKVEYKLEDYILTKSNLSAYNMIMLHHENWQSHRMIVCGPSGCGKTHLLSIWAKANDAWLFDAKDINAINAKYDGQALAIDNFDQDYDNLAMFGVLNQAQNQHRPVLIMSRNTPGDLNTTLFDLKSRLEGSSLSTISLPDDETLSLVLIKHFQDRQLTIRPDVIRYIVTRIERTYDAAYHIVSKIDRLSLTQKIPITKRLVTKVLDSLLKTSND